MHDILLKYSGDILNVQHKTIRISHLNHKAGCFGGLIMAKEFSSGFQCEGCNALIKS